jgi:hypothetical protein
MRWTSNFRQPPYGNIPRTRCRRRVVSAAKGQSTRSPAARKPNAQLHSYSRPSCLTRLNDGCSVMPASLNHVRSMLQSRCLGRWRTHQIGPYDLTAMPRVPPHSNNSISDSPSQFGPYHQRRPSIPFLHWGRPANPTASLFGASFPVVNSKGIFHNADCIR